LGSRRELGVRAEGRRFGALWWLHPRFSFSVLGIGFLLGAYLIPQSTYETLYRSEKRLDLDFLTVALIVYLGAIAGTFFRVRLGEARESEPRERERALLLYCRWFVWPLFAFTIFGYAAWFGNAALIAGGPGAVLQAMLGVLLQPGLSNVSYVKNQLFQNISGITTFTQFGIMYATVEALLWVQGGSRRRIAALRFLAVALLALARAMVLAERLALVEVIIPVVVVLAGDLSARGARMRLLRTAPVFLWSGAFGLFALAEYFRSWDFYRNVYNGAYLQFAADRFMGYYATALNNAAVYYLYEPVRPLRHSLRSLFQAPIIGGFADERYRAIFGGYSDLKLLLQTYATPEFNNVAPVGLWLNEYSVFLAPVAAFVIGVISTSLYRSFLEGRMVAALLYPSWFIGLLEISRVYFWSSQRYFPVLAFLVLSLLLFQSSKVPVSGTPGGAREMRTGTGRPVEPERA
jgi:hypothetical protein